MARSPREFAGRLIGSPRDSGSSSHTVAWDKIVVVVGRDVWTTPAERPNGDPVPFLDALATFPPDEGGLAWSSEGPRSCPVLPLLAATWMWTQSGRTEGHRLFLSPVDAVLGRRVHGHWFSARRILALSPEEARTRAERGEALLSEYAASLSRRWDEEWYPEIRGHFEWWDQALAHLSTPDHVARAWQDADRRGRRIEAIHFTIVFTAHFALRRLDNLCRELFASASEVSAGGLTTGEHSWTTRTAEALDDLVKMARQDSFVSESFQHDDPLVALRTTEKGSAFLDELFRVIDRFGRKLQGGLLDVSWVEEPGIVVDMIRSAIRGDYVPVPPEKIRKDRDRVMADALMALEGYPAPVREEFLAQLDAGRQAARLLEDHNFWIDQQLPYWTRALALKSAAILTAAGRLSNRDDVWHLGLAELTETVLGPPGSLDAVAQASRAEIEKYSRRWPPAHLGEAWPEVPAHPLTRHPGAPEPPAAILDPMQLTGVAGSPGTVVAPVRVIGQLSEAPGLQLGEVLVTGSTSSDWVAWYRLAAGVVTDVGGALTHGAIVARELGIPMVVATRNATVRLKTGMMVEVDGSRGVVRIVQHPPCDTPLTP